MNRLLISTSYSEPWVLITPLRNINSTYPKVVVPSADWLR